MLVHALYDPCLGAHNINISERKERELPARKSTKAGTTYLLSVGKGDSHSLKTIDFSGRYRRQ